FPKNIYYCNDDHIGACGHQHLPVKRYPTMAERQMTEKSCFCVTTSNYLTHKLQAYHQKVYEIPLGGPPPQTTSEQRDFREKPSIIVGLLGALHASHLSVHVINQIIKEPDFCLTLVGNNSEQFKQQIDHPERAVFRGVLTGSQLFDEMCRFDVAIAPYNLEKINAGVSPNKLFQYLACACPVVISDIPNIRGIKYPPGTVYVAPDDKSFTGRIRQAIAEDCPEYANTRLHYASENTWEKRIQRLLFHLEENGLVE
ncbi:MAG: glycosyltransferase, partial [Kiritimatiellaceae bacterium]|nr:glycosyltransferase [Kiritimatiellaceae bacterium]